MNIPMHMDDPARLELIAQTRPEMLLPHHWKSLQEFGSKVMTIAFPRHEERPTPDRQAA